MKKKLMSGVSVFCIVFMLVFYVQSAEMSSKYNVNNGTATASKTAEAGNAEQSFSFSELGRKATEKADSNSLGIKAVDNGVEIVCKLQALEALVTSSGISIKSTSDTEGSGEFNMKVAGLGRMNNAMSPVSSDATVTATQVYSQIIRQELVEEYTVSGDGIRQDFIVLKRPKGNGELALAVGLSGATAEFTGSGLKIRLSETGREFAYSNLLVTDSTGKKLPAEFKINSHYKFIVSIDDSDAVYPIRIDPTISDANWISIGDMGGEVYAVACDSSGNLYAGGVFLTAGGISAKYFAKWNGSTWSKLGDVVPGSGPNGSVDSIACDSSGNIYVGGQFYDAVYNQYYITKWNGSSWNALGSGLNSYANALVCDSSGNLYVAGSFTTAGGVSANRIAKWNGSSWSALGSGIDSKVNALAYYSGTLYAGGEFYTAGGVSVNYVAKWNGSSWSALGSGAGGYPVNALACDSSGNLYMGGAFLTAGGVSASKIAKWNGSSWSALGSGMNGSVTTLTFDYSGNLYAGGAFSTAGGVNIGYGIAKWDGSSWSALGSGVNQYIRAIARDSYGNIYAGGPFTVAGGKTSRYIAKCLIPYTVNFITDGTSGATLTGTTTQIVNGGGSCSAVTANAPASYNFSKWTKSGADYSTNNPLTVTNVTKDMTFTAVFSIKTFTLTYTAGANGSVTGTSPQTVNYNANGTAVTAVPSTGYHFVNWSDSSTSNPRTDTNVTANISVTANFAANDVQITRACSKRSS